ncbi:MAG: malate dehydrogenase [Puniceicoccaceae bacterium MED-G30]|jgi:IMP dehydrogenase|nr:MAG: malate dehydrogenase [Puniceicoccaceae bacterium MED-G30]RPG83153.1 MAG: CBS domain-containing protein [Coraliomargarita sp. TMED73]
MKADAASRMKEFYLPANEFFPANLPTGLTYDDISLATLYSETLPSQTSLVTRLSESLELQIPILSSDMDTVTEARMAIQMALNGGLGLIHYNMSDEKQIKEVARVKNHIHGFIQEPIKVGPNQSIAEVIDYINERGFGFSTFPVVDEENKLLGLLPGRVVKPRYADRLVSEAMTPRDQVYTLDEKEIINDPIKTADRFFTEHLGIHKLLVVDAQDRLRGLFTLSDIERIEAEAQQSLKPARDDDFRLRCGAAIATHRTAEGALDADRIVQHVGHLVDEGVDAVAVSTAHGFSKGVGDALTLLRSQFPELTLIAGNVTSAEGVAFLADAGADTIKIGQGPGSICTTRIVAGVGIPQMTALYAAAQAAREKNVSILADGGIAKSGDIVKALTLADAVLCGSLLAGCNEAPGQIIEINGKLYKQYRGMGSSAAMKEGSAARYGHSRKDVSSKAAAEGIEALKESAGSLSGVLRELVGGIQSGMGYLGAPTLPELRKKARYIRVSPAGQKESAPHDVITVKTSEISGESGK